MNTEEKKEAILQARSVKLAKVEDRDKTALNGLSVLLFSLSDELYAIETSFVDEVFPIKELTILPNVPTFVSGLIQVRRKIYSVIDVRQLFGIVVGRAEENNRAIILKSPTMAFGLLANEIVGMHSVSYDALQPPLPSMHGVYLEFVRGITSERIVVLDGENLLNSSTLIVSQA